MPPMDVPGCAPTTSCSLYGTEEIPLDNGSTQEQMLCMQTLGLFYSPYKDILPGWIPKNLFFKDLVPGITH